MDAPCATSLALGRCRAADALCGRGPRRADRLGAGIGAAATHAARWRDMASGALSAGARDHRSGDHALRPERRRRDRRRARRCRQPDAHDRGDRPRGRGGARCPRQMRGLRHRHPRRRQDALRPEHRVRNRAWRRRRLPDRQCPAGRGAAGGDRGRRRAARRLREAGSRTARQGAAAERAPLPGGWCDRRGDASGGTADRLRRSPARLGRCQGDPRHPQQALPPDDERAGACARHHGPP